jgi:hypothetical protein
VRRSYLTAGRKARIDWKALSQRVGHSDVAFTIGNTLKLTWKPIARWRTPSPS